MPNRRYQAGRRAEWAVRDQYEALGYIVVRSAGSKGKIDIVALDDVNGKTYIAQVKTTKDGGIAEAARLWREFCAHPPTRANPNFSRVLWVKCGRDPWRTYHMD